MNKFVVNIFLFFLVVVGVCCILSPLNLFLIKKTVLKSRYFQFDDSVTILMLGDSQVELSLNPEHIPGSENRAQSAEHYLFTEARLRYYLDNNPQIQTVILGFTFLNLDKGRRDDRLFEKEDDMKSHFVKGNIMLLDFDAVKLLYDNSFVYYRSVLGWKLGIPMKETVSTIIGTSKLYWMNAGFVAAPKTDIFDSEEMARLHYGSNQIAEINKKYLYKIVELCKEKNVQLILYSNVQYPEYYALIPDLYKEEYAKIKEELYSLYGVSCFDYSTYCLPDSCFKDANHLNIYGAEKISKEIALRISNLE